MMTNLLTQPLNPNETCSPKDKSAEEHSEQADIFAGLLLSLNNTMSVPPVPKGESDLSVPPDVANRSIMPSPSALADGSDLSVPPTLAGGSVIKNTPVITTLTETLHNIPQEPIQDRSKQTPPLLSLKEFQLSTDEFRVTPSGVTSPKVITPKGVTLNSPESVTLNLLETKSETIGEINTKAELFSNPPTEFVKETLIAKDVQLLSNAKASAKEKIKEEFLAVNEVKKNDSQKPAESFSKPSQQQKSDVVRIKEAGGTSENKNKNFSEHFDSSKNASAEKQEIVHSKNIDSSFNSDSTELNVVTKNLDAVSKFSSTIRNTESDTPKVLLQTIAALVAEAKTNLPNQEVRFIRFRLNPEKFGTLEIKIESDAQGRLNALLVAEKEIARRTLNDGMIQLRQELEKAGFQIERLSVSIGQNMNSNAQSNERKFSSEEFTNTSFSAPNEKQNNSESEVEDRLLSLRA